MNRGFVLFQVGSSWNQNEKILAAFIWGWDVCWLFRRSNTLVSMLLRRIGRLFCKSENEPWAGEAFAAIRSKVEKYVDRHQTDPEWITSRLAMYWKDGERYTQCYLKNRIGTMERGMLLFPL